MDNAPWLRRVAHATAAVYGLSTSENVKPNSHAQKSVRVCYVI